MLVGTVVFLGVACVLFLLLVASQLAGRSFGIWQRTTRPRGFWEAQGVVEGALFALLGLLVAFTFAGAQSRLDARRELIVREANAVGTAYLRLDLLPADAQPMIRDEFRRYLDARVGYYRHLLQAELRHREHDRATVLQSQIWRDVLDAAQDGPDAHATLLLVPALNDMFDVTSARDTALRTHVPALILVVVVLLELVCAFFAGVRMSRVPEPSRLHIVTFAGILALMTYAILDVEFPRLGLSNVRSMDLLLLQLRASMG